jgi:folate-binding protein YgfZ
MSTVLIPSLDDAAVREIASRCGAQVSDDPHGPQTLFPLPPGQPVSPDAAEGLALLADWGIVSATGADAVGFLQGQTTNDIAGQPADEVRLNAYCTPKGRVLAAGPLWRDGDARLRFAVSRPLAAPLRKRLAMYVLRAKASIDDDSDRFAILGLAGEAARAALGELGIDAPGPMRLARAAVARPAEDQAACLAIGMPEVAGFGPRWWLVVPLEHLSDVWQRLAARLAPRPSAWWRASEVLSGMPRVVAATSEAFVPQSLNWELIGGVSFRKGCYPGQEVVARLHYRGKPKRRTFIGRIAASGDAPAPGADLLDTDGRPAGLVISSAPAPDGGILLLHEAQIDAAQQGALLTADGRSVTPLALPYPIPSDTESSRAQPGEPAR